MKSCEIDKVWFAKRFALTLDEVSHLISDDELSGLIYEKLDQVENDKQVAIMVAKNKSTQFRVSNQESNPVWEKGWGEVYERLSNSKSIIEDILKPQYFDKGKFLRFEGQYIRTHSKDFEYRLDLLIRKITFYKYFSNVDAITELGCGTGNSLLLLNRLFPEKKLLGADWAVASQKLLRKIASATQANIHSVNFNMFTLEGKHRLNLDRNTALLTIHALEQLGSDFELLLTYIIKCQPIICVHLEPIMEFYQQGVPFDDVACDYHKKRNYLSGFYTQLKKYELEGQVEILEAKRLGFGGDYHEAYSLVVWKVISKNE
jgi:hypothetical protein